MHLVKNKYGAYYNDDGKRHREDGPALECISGKDKGYVEYWFDGEFYWVDCNEDWIKLVKKLKLKKLLK